MPKNPKRIQDEIDRKTGGKGKKSPGKKFVPTDAQRKLVKDLASDGLSQDQVRYYIRDESELPISLDTFRDHFDVEWMLGSNEVARAVGKNMIDIASKNKGMPGVVAANNVMSTKFKAHGWSNREDVTKIEVSGKDGDAIKVDHSIDVSREVAELFASHAGTKAASDQTDPGLAQESET